MILGESKEIRMQEHTPEWDAHRAEHYNASDAPAMMGVSKYKTRDQLLDETVTGIKPEITPQQQKIFDRGHFNEECTREHLKTEEGLVFVKSIFTNGKLSASLDGKDLVKVTHMECKSMNNDLREFFGGYATDKEVSKLDISYRIQMEQGFICNPKAEKCLFVAASFEDDGTLLEIAWCFYKPDLELQKQIIAGWEQFEQDLITHKPKQEKSKPVVAEIAPLPTVIATVSAQVLDTNIQEVAKTHKKWIKDIKPASELTTDEDFAYGEKLVKFCDDFEKKCANSEDMVLSQAASVNDVISSLRSMKEGTRQIRLDYKKTLDKQKELIKSNAVLEAKQAWSEHINALNPDLHGAVDLNDQLFMPDFPQAIKGKRTFKSMQSAINNLMATSKREANQECDRISRNVAYLVKSIEGYEHLFNIPALAIKDHEFIELQIKSTIADENARLEKVKQDAIEAEKAKAEQTEKQASIPDGNGIKPEPSITAVVNNPIEEAQKIPLQGITHDEGMLSERSEIIGLVAMHFDIDFTEAERKIIAEFGVKAA